MCMFVSAQPVYVFWLVRLIHFHLRYVWSSYHFLNCVGFIFCMSFPLLCFLPREVPSAFVVKLVWWCWILLTFTSLESFWFLHQIWMRVLLGRRILGYKFFPFITLNRSCHSLLACRVSVEKSVDSLMGVLLYGICHFSLVVFNLLSLFLIFASFTTMCLGVFFLGFNLPGTLLSGLGWLFLFPC